MLICILPPHTRMHGHIAKAHTAHVQMGMYATARVYMHEHQDICGHITAHVLTQGMNGHSI